MKEDNAKKRGYLAQHPLFDQVTWSVLTLVTQTRAVSSVIWLYYQDYPRILFELGFDYTVLKVEF